MPIIDIASRRPAQQIPSSRPVVSQERLRRGMELIREEIRIAREMREFALQIEADLQAGAEVELGDLVFDRELKVARRRTASPVKSVAVRR
jgi:hypothetical protein